MKQRIKRIISMLCAAAVSASMLPPVTAAAAVDGSDLPINGYVAEQAADTVTPDTASHNAFVVTDEANPANGVYTVGTENRSSALNGKIWADKSVEAGDNGTFDVTLSALGQTFASTTTTKNEVALDVVFVVDVSYSMGYGMASDSDSYQTNAEDTRMYATVNALNSAANELMKNENNRVGVAVFAGSASQMVPLQHYEKSGSSPFFSYTGHKVPEGFWESLSGSLNFTSVGNPTYSKSYASATDPQSGFFAAADMLKNSDIPAGSSERIPVVVLLTDGAPNDSTQYYKTGSSDDGSAAPEYVSGDSRPRYDVRDWYYAICTAAYQKEQITANYRAKQNSTDTQAKFFTIGLSLKDGTDNAIMLDPKKRTDTTTPGTLSAAINLNTPAKMGFASYDYADQSFVGQMSQQDLENIFNTIVGEITSITGGENVGESTGGRNNMNFFDTLGEQVRLNGDFKLEVPTYTTVENEMKAGKTRTYTLAPHKKVSGEYVSVSGQEAQTLVNSGETLYLRPTAVTVDTDTTDLDATSNAYDKAALNELEVTVRKLQNGRRQLQVSIPPDLMAYNVLNVKEANGQKTASYYESAPIRFRYDAALMNTAAAGTYLLSEPSQTYLSFMPKSEQVDGKYIMPYYWAQTEKAFDKTVKAAGTAVAGSVNYVCQSTMDSNKQVYIYLGNNGLYTLKGKTLTLDIHWNDNSNIAGKRFENISVQLYRDVVNGKDPAAPDNTAPNAELVKGQQVRLGLSDVKADNENLWSRLFQDLPVYSADGNYYRYWLQFVPETEGQPDDSRGYTVDIFNAASPNHENGKLIKDGGTWWFCFRTQQGGQGESLKENANLAIEFTREAETVDLTIEKKWDSGISDKPESIEVLLYANGQLVNDKGVAQKDENAAKITITGTDSWTKTLSGLPYYVKGGKGATIAYNVIETGDLAKDYTTTKDYKFTGVEGFEDTKVTITLTNHKSVDKTALTAVKYWDDNENQDGIRKPVTVKLTATVDGQKLNDSAVTGLLESSETLEKTISNTTDGASVTWENLPKTSGGKPVTYSAEETRVGGTSLADSGYTAAYSKTGDTVMITNTHTPETVSITVKKEWDDGSNQDGIRPANISGVLYQQVSESDPINAVRSFATRDGNTVTLEGLPKYSEGKEIKYYVSEDAVKGYTLTNKDSVKALNGTTVYPVTMDTEGKIGSITLTNRHAPATLAYQVDITWDDLDNRDKQRPAELTLTLQGEGENGIKTQTYSFKLTVGDSGITAVQPETPNGVTATFADNTVTIAGLPEYMDKVQLDYSAALTGASPYTVTKTGMTADSSAFTLFYRPGPLQLSFQKVWADNENAAGKRPGTYVYALTYLTLTRTAAQGAEETVNAIPSVTAADNAYTITYSGLDKYDSEGRAYTYKVTESDVPNYTASRMEVVLTGDGEKKIINTYSYTQEFYEPITVEKQWQDTDGSGKRPAIPESYSKESGNDPLNIRLYLTDGSQTDENAGIQPDKIEQKPDDPNVWVYTWNNVPKTDNAGKQLLYTAYENAALKDYVATTKYVNVTADGTTQGAIVNTLNSEAVSRGSLTIKKDWKSDESYQDKRPDSLTFTVVGEYEGGTNNISRIVTMQKDTWTVTVDNLPLSVNGKAVTYTVTENNVPAGYTPMYSGGVTLEESTVKEITVTNTYTPDKFKLTYNGNGASGIAPVDTTDYTQVNHTATLLNQGGLTYEGMVFLGWNESITPIVTTEAQKNAMTILAVDSEYMVNGSTVLYAVWALDENGDNIPDYEQKTVTVNIVWQDGGNVCGIRPTDMSFTLNDKSYMVDLKNDAGVLVNTNGGNTEWTYIVPDKFGVGDAFTADSITEVTVRAKAHADAKDDSTYTVEKRLEGDIFTITLTHMPETTTHTVNKTWENESAAVTPTGATVVLYANGTQVGGSEKTLDYNSGAENSYTWTGLDKYKGGHLITYHAVETSVPSADGELMPHFKVAYDWDAVGETHITNTYSDTRSITMLYEWDDDNNAAGTRPTAIKVQLYNGDESVGEAVTITSAGNWEAMWNGLDKNTAYTAKVVGYMDAEGDEHSVELSEGVPGELGEGYDFQMFSFGEGSVFVAESALDNVAEVTVTKNWNDSENKFSTRPEKIWVNLLKNGVIEKSAELTADNGWQYTWSALAEYEDGDAVDYTVQEIPVPGYTA
ncbi:MAG: Cna B-type domain-containing protein, partial [Agathobaculum sp.]|uniref:Cna B-type domain-containing protein n=1 Tax=Agathobaculum sp. TaxID=2048138 RepID=UPI003D92AAA1